jgi:hypothetical protein
MARNYSPRNFCARVRNLERSERDVELHGDQLQVEAQACYQGISDVPTIPVSHGLV